MLHQGLQRFGCTDFHLKGRDGSLQTVWDEALLHVVMEDWVREEGQRADMKRKPHSRDLAEASYSGSEGV